MAPYLTIDFGQSFWYRRKAGDKTNLKGKTMTIGVSICRVSRVPAAAEMADLNAEHHALYGDTFGGLTILRDPKDPNQTAAVFQINDLDGFLTVSRSPEGDALMRKWGVVEPLSFFHDDT